MTLLQIALLFTFYSLLIPSNLKATEDLPWEVKRTNFKSDGTIDYIKIERYNRATEHNRKMISSHFTWYNFRSYFPMQFDEIVDRANILPWSIADRIAENLPKQLSLAESNENKALQIFNELFEKEKTTWQRIKSEAKEKSKS